MNWFHVVVKSKTSGPSWRQMGIPDGTSVTDTLMVAASEPALAERQSLEFVEDRSGRVEIVVESTTPISADQVVIPVTSSLG